MSSEEPEKNVLEESVYKFALKNASDHGGKASSSAVMGHVLNENPSFKDNINDVRRVVSDLTMRVNALTHQEQKAILEEKYPKLLEHEKRIKALGLPDLPKAKYGKVVTGYPPEPSGYPHIGHAKASLVNYLLSEKYGGKFILRFDDANPSMISKEFYKVHLDTYKWLGINVSNIIYVSDHVQVMYEKAEDMIRNGSLYLCTCSPAEMSRNRMSKTECACLMRSPTDSLFLWNQMLSGEADTGSMVVRLRGDLQSDNTTMRDPVMFRILEDEHPRVGKKYRVWPNYDFYTPFEDGHLGITHRYRSKEFELFAELHNFIQDKMGFPSTWREVWGRLNLTDMAVDMPSSKREIRKLIEEGAVEGWDDVRLPSLAAFKRRGFAADGVKNFVLRIGVTKNDAKISVTVLEAENRKVIDPVSNRYFFVRDPVMFTVDGVLPKSAELPLHPEKSKKMRTIKVPSKKIFLSSNDARTLEKGVVFRLKDLANVEVVSDSKLKIIDVDEMPSQKVHWLPEKSIPCEMLMPDNKVISGLVEVNILDEKKNKHVQLERVGYAFTSELDKKLVKLVYTHK